MWGRRRKRGTRLSRLLALGRLEDALARAEQQQEGEPEPVPYAPASSPAPDVPAARPGLRAEDVPVDNSAGPAADTAAEEDATPQHHQGLPVQRSRDGTRHGSFG
jgi:hypothetical protein